MAEDDVKPDPAPPSWLTIVRGVLATTVSVLAVFATILGGYNSSRISSIEHTSEVNKVFADSLYQVRADLSSSRDATPAMIEAAEIYSLAETPQRKLVLVEILSQAKQTEALGALATLISVDDDIQDPKGRDKKVATAINSLVESQIEAIDAVTPTPSAPPKNGIHATPAPSTGGDVSLTTTGAAAVEDRAKLAAALPNVQPIVGWVFIGDAPKDVSQPGGGLDIETAETNAVKIPARSLAPIFACDDLNVREHPFMNGKLGRLIAIVGEGTPMTVKGAPEAHAGISVADHRPIEAIWVPVTIGADPVLDVTKCTVR
jgi:hypothetical protein